MYTMGFFFAALSLSFVAPKAIRWSKTSYSGRCATVRASQKQQQQQRQQKKNGAHNERHLFLLIDRRKFFMRIILFALIKLINL